MGVLDFAEEQGALLMVLDYVHGYHVGQWLKYLREVGRQIPWEIAVLVTLRVLSALHAVVPRTGGRRSTVRVQGASRYSRW